MTNFTCYEGDNSVLVMVDLKMQIIRKIKISSHYRCAACVCDPGYTLSSSVCYQDSFVATVNTPFQSPSLAVGSSVIDCLPQTTNITNSSSASNTQSPEEQQS